MIRKDYTGVDLLKFIMALLVVMIHVKPNTHSEVLTAIFNPLMSIAVPTFFVLSSVFIFNKLQGGGKHLLTYCRRLVILYFCWFIIDIWFIIFKRPYITEGFPDGLIQLFKDFIFATTYPGSWFISALLVSVCLVYLFEKISGKTITLLITLVLSVYFKSIELFPDSWHCLYDWYSENFRKDITLSFPANMIWISIGSIIGSKLDLIARYKKQILIINTIICFICYFFQIIFYSSFIVNYLLVPAICAIAFSIDLGHETVLKRLRNYSILIFFAHFSIAGKMNLFCHFVGDSLITNWIYYIIVVFASIAFAAVILDLEKKPHLHFLRYLH